jgi:hypothetical protein
LYNAGSLEVDTGDREAPGTALRKGRLLRHAVLPADPILAVSPDGEKWSASEE